MTRMKKSLVSLLVVAFLALGVMAPMAARASEAGRRNTTYALGAVTAYLLLKKQWLPAAIAAGGAYVAYHNYQAEVNARNRWQNGYYRHRGR